MARVVVVVVVLCLWISSVWAADGSAVYQKKCKVCHSLAGAKGAKAEIGGPLDGVGAKRDAAWLKSYFADPTSKIPKAKMPKMKLSAEDWDAVTQYLLTFK